MKHRRLSPIFHHGKVSERHCGEGVAEALEQLLAEK